MKYGRRSLIIGLGLFLSVLILPTTDARLIENSNQPVKENPTGSFTSNRAFTLEAGGASLQNAGTTSLKPTVSQAIAFVETPNLRDLRPAIISSDVIQKLSLAYGDHAKNEEPDGGIRPAFRELKTGVFTDATINTLKQEVGGVNVVTNPLQNFDGPDMDTIEPLFGGRFAPPSVNAAVGPNHVVVTTNGVVQVFNKSGVAAGPAVRISALMVGIANASDDDGDPIVLYDSLADRWLVAQFNLRVTSNSTHEHVAISQTGDPTGSYFAYDFLFTANRPADLPHLAVWPDGYYMSTNDFSLPVFSSPFQGAGLYALERTKMLAGDPTAKIIGFNTDATHGGMLPSNFQGFTPPPVGTPNLFVEFDADEFGAATDLIRTFAFHADFNTPANSTLTQGPDIPTAAFDARQPVSRADVDQPSPGEALDAIADRLMHPLNFRILPGGVQSYVLNFTVNVSGVNPTNAATYQAGVRWMELRRDPGTGAVTISQQATYAPGSGNGITGRNVWMASVAQDGEGNIGLAASATGPGPTPAALNPTAIYTGRLAADTPNTLPQGEVDALSTVTKGVQTATFNRWGDYSSLFTDPDDCTFWGAFEYVDSPTASFDWNTRIFSFKVNPACTTSPRGSFTGTVTNCATGLPVQGAIVKTDNGFIRTTAANGTYSISAAPGTYNVNVSKPGTGFNSVSGTVTVSDGGSAVFNACLQPSPIIASAGATLVSESCTPANGAIDPAETITVSLCVQNTGSLDTTNLVGTLQSTGGVFSPSGPQNYGVAIAGGPPVCRNFTFTAGVAAVCGSSITATVHLQDGATDLGNVTYIFTLGTIGLPLTRSFTFSPGVTIPDNSPAGVNIPIVVSGVGTIGDLNFRIDGTSCNTTNPSLTVGVDHSWVGDLTFKLTSPSNTTVTIIERPGAGLLGSSGNNFCQTLLDDDGAFSPIDSIDPAGAPYTGTFKPQNPLSAFDGESADGAWTLNVSDNASGDTGFVRAFSLIFQPRACCNSPCSLTCPANITTSNDPNQCGAVVNFAAATPSGSCGPVLSSPASGSFFPVGTTTVTARSNNGAGPETCTFTVTVNDTQPPTTTCPANITTPPDPGQNTAVVNYPSTSSSDNCPGVTQTFSPPSGSTFPVGTTTVTKTATDASGNTATCTFTVTVGEVIKFSSANYIVSENGGSVLITVNRLGSNTQPATVDYATSDMTATERKDYTTALGTLTFGVGDTTKTFTVLVNIDAFTEGSELVGLTLSGTTGGAVLGVPANATIQIDDSLWTGPPANPIDDAQNFVRQHYHDFLNREPDAAGLAFWTNQITGCGSDATCTEIKRIHVSAAFFLSIEFQETGVTAYLANKAAFGPPLPRYTGLMRDTQALQRDYIFTQPGSAAVLEANKVAFFNEFVLTIEFNALYGSTPNDQYVDALIANTGVTFTQAERDALVNGLNGGTETRATVLRKISEKPSFRQAEFMRSFVIMEYFGYLRRNPDDAPDGNLNGYNFWLNKLNQFNGDFIKAEMVKAFLSSTEYRQRFGN